MLAVWFSWKFGGRTYDVLENPNERLVSHRLQIQKHSRAKEHIHVAVAVKRLDASEPIPGVSTYFHIDIKIWSERRTVCDSTVN
jgi:hypothetical protein